MNEVTTIWHKPPARPDLSASDIHIWYIRSHKPHLFPLNNMTRSLSLVEQLKAKQLSPILQKRYIIRRFALRSILSRYIGTSPKDVQFQYGPHGKPYLKSNINNKQLMFNVSHSHETSLIAVTEEGNTGIDIEHIHFQFSLKLLVNQYFTTRERNEINSLSPELQTKKTFAIWTNKEAYLKARGDNIFALLQFRNTSQCSNVNNYTNTKYKHNQCTKYSGHTFTPDSEHVATVISQHINPYFHYWQWTNSCI